MVLKDIIIFNDKRRTLDKGNACNRCDLQTSQIFLEPPQSRREHQPRPLNTGPTFIHLYVHQISPGDEVVLASTDFDWRQAEVKTIVDCDDCKPNQIRVEGRYFVQKSVEKNEWI